MGLLNKYLHDAPSGLHENLLYILIISVVLSLLSTYYYLKLIKMALFDVMNSASAPTIEVRNLGEITMPVAIVAALGALTVG